MNKMEKWWPFKFRRGDNKISDPKTTTETASGLPAAKAAFDPFQLFDQRMTQLWREPFAGFPSTLGFFGDFSPAKFNPVIDVADEESHIRVSVELPGVTKDQVNVSIENGFLTIRGEKKQENETRENGVYRVERSYGSFMRSVPLPPEVDETAGDATFDKGILSIRFPKTETKPETARQIPVKG
ncbi:MAG: Hsp20/alpha crystallin family protein [Myxococcales bacterium]|nr:Hsp20/alpha crystallin family protein [Myxococcales bacterium]